MEECVLKKAVIKSFRIFLIWQYNRIRPDYSQRTLFGASSLSKVCSYLSQHFSTTEQHKLEIVLNRLSIVKVLRTWLITKDLPYYYNTMCPTIFIFIFLSLQMLSGMNCNFCNFLSMIFKNDLLFKRNSLNRKGSI